MKGGQAGLGSPTQQTLVQVLKQAGEDLTRANIMRQACTPQEPPVASAPARHHCQHKSDRLSPDRAAPTHAVRWRAMGAVWRAIIIGMSPKEPSKPLPGPRDQPWNAGTTQ